MLTQKNQHSTTHAGSSITAMPQNCMDQLESGINLNDKCRKGVSDLLYSEDIAFPALVSVLFFLFVKGELPSKTKRPTQNFLLL